jgi:hypothetical protein
MVAAIKRLSFVMFALWQCGRRAVARSARPILQAASAHAVPQAAEVLSTPHAAPRVAASAVLPQAPFRSQHTKATVKRDEKSNRLCEAEGCRTVASFGSPVDGVTVSCGTHKQEGHVNLKHKRCEADGCDKRPHFGSPVDRVQRFCGPHKKEGHVDLKKKKVFV